MIPRFAALRQERPGKPRASGDDPANPVPVLAQVVNPARAGMIPEAATKERAARGKPRASGDDPVLPAPSRQVRP